MEKTVACFMKGYRTLAAVFSFLIVGALSVVGTLDLTPLVALFVKDQAYVGVAMLGIGALFGWLRWITSTPLANSGRDYVVDWANSPDVPHKHGIDGE